MATDQQLLDLAYAMETQLSQNNKGASLKAITNLQLSELLTQLKEDRLPSRNLAAYRKIRAIMLQRIVFKHEDNMFVITNVVLSSIKAYLSKLKLHIPEIGDSIQIIHDEKETKEFVYDSGVNYEKYHTFEQMAYKFYDNFHIRYTVTGPFMLVKGLLEDFHCPNSFLPIRFASVFGVPLYDVANRYNSFIKDADYFGEKDLVNAVYDFHLTNPNGLQQLKLLLDAPMKARKIIHHFETYYPNNATKIKESLLNYPATQEYDAPDVLEREPSPKRVIEGEEPSPKRVKETVDI